MKVNFAQITPRKGNREQVTVLEPHLHSIIVFFHLVIVLGSTLNSILYGCVCYRICTQLPICTSSMLLACSSIIYSLQKRSAFAIIQNIIFWVKN